VASAWATSGAVVMTQRLTPIASARMMIKVSPSERRFRERCMALVFLLPVYPGRTWPLYHKSRSLPAILLFVLSAFWLAADSEMGRLSRDGQTAMRTKLLLRARSFRPPKPSSEAGGGSSSGGRRGGCRRVRGWEGLRWTGYRRVRGCGKFCRGGCWREGGRQGGTWGFGRCGGVGRGMGRGARQGGSDRDRGVSRGGRGRSDSRELRGR
jgi:hypothetical protein